MSKKVAVPLIVLAVMFASLGGYIVADAYDVVPGIFTTKPADPRLEVPETTVAKSSVDTTGNFALNPDAPMPDKAQVQAQLDGFLESVGKEETTSDAPLVVSMKVTDTLTGQELGSIDADQLVTPASTNKVFTAATALETLGGEHRFSTSCLLDKTTLYLHAGGDQMVARGRGNASDIEGYAGLYDLAQRCADKLRTQGIKQVSIKLDDTIYGTTRVHPQWVSQSVQQWAAPISPLAVNVGYTNELRSAHVADPAIDAASSFVTHMKDLGIGVEGTLSREKTPAKAKELAHVDSATVAEITDVMLTRSDNSLAEGLCWASAVHEGKDANFEQATQLVRSTVTKFGVKDGELTNLDCSGLSHDTKTNANALTAVLQAAASDKHPHLETLPSLMPISALTGTLANRYFSDGIAGKVRLKTGSLEGVSSIAGYVMTESGRTLTVVMLTYSADPVKHAAAFQQLNTRVENIAKL